MNNKVTPPKLLAVIRESECIGCTKCIDACPVDAILGSAKQMHTVIASECIGCKLCLPPCPVDCIDLIPVPVDHTRIPPEHVKNRYQARKQRLLAQQENEELLSVSAANKRDYVAEAIARAARQHRER